ncbi:unnamed protein product [Cunninghamella echinulata]
MSLPFGLKAPSRGTVIFASIVSTLGGGYYASSYYVENSRQALNNRVSWLADCPCGVHERPRKVQIFITAPPGDGLEKSRNWFSHYVKPVLVAAAIDYEVKEAKEAGQIESLVRDEIIKRRQLEKQASTTQLDDPSSNDNNNLMKDYNNNNSMTGLSMPSSLQQQGQQDLSFTNNPAILKPTKENDQLEEFDGVIAIGRKAWGEVLSGLNKGCHANLIQVEKEKKEAELKKKLEEDKKALEEAQQQQQKLQEGEEKETNEQHQQEEMVSTDIIMNDDINNQTEEEVIIEQDNGIVSERDVFSVPTTLSPLIYIPHENIIGWTNIPYRIYMWLMDYQRIDRFGDYAVNVALNKTRPLEKEDIDVGYQEIKYWVGDDDAKKVKENDQPIEIDDQVRKELKTYTSN